MYTKATLQLVTSIFTLFLFALPASALSVSRFTESPALNPTLKTHVFVMGYGGGLVDQFFKTAVARARKYQENFPDRQYVFIGPDKIDKTSASYDSYEEYRAVLQRLKLTPERLDEKYLLSNRLLEILENYTQIESLEFMSHSAAHLGVGLDDVPSNSPLAAYKRFNAQSEGLAELRDNFTENAFLVLHGCNSGFTQAPAFAKILGIPSAGSLSSTNTQEIYSDNRWYFNDTGRYPQGLRKSATNDISYLDNLECRSGHCHRLKPEAYPYAGYWGNLNAGLSHYKFFCGTATADNQCKKTMALFLAGHVGVAKNAASLIADYKNNIKDFLCPDSNRPEARRDCFNKLESSLTDSSVYYSGMTRGKTLNCDFEKCDVEIRCTDAQGSCQVLSAPDNPRPTTMQREYRAYVEGFELLNFND